MVKLGDNTKYGEVIWIDKISELVPDPLIKVSDVSGIKYRASELEAVTKEKEEIHMSQSRLPETIIYRVEDGKLVPDGLVNKIREEALIKSLENGQKWEITHELTNDDASYAQLAKVHACVREVAKDTGHTVDDIKNLVKQKAGLYSDPGKLRSFANCSKAELSAAIQAVIEIGDDLGINLNQV